MEKAKLKEKVIAKQRKQVSYDPHLGCLDSPSNRYTGDWSGFGGSYFRSKTLMPPSKEEANYGNLLPLYRWLKKFRTE